MLLINKYAVSQMTFDEDVEIDFLTNYNEMHIALLNYKQLRPLKHLRKCTTPCLEHL